MRVRWGVIGAGGIADRRTIPEGILPARNAELVALLDKDVSLLKALSKKYGVKAHMDLESLAQDKDIQAVYVATPIYLHQMQTITCLKAGENVLCEKTMAMNPPECRQMLNTAKQHRVKLGIAFIMRFHSFHRLALKLVEQGKIGTLVTGRAQLSCWYPKIAGAWRQVKRMSSGGSLIDLASHCLDLLEMFLGKIVEVSCLADRRIFDYEVEDTSLVLTRHETGACGVVDACFNIVDAGSKNRLELYGTKGSILCEGTIGQLPTGKMVGFLSEEKEYEAKQKRGPEEGVEFKPEPVNTYLAEIEDFSDAILQDRPPAYTGEMGLHNQQVLEACYASARMRKVVSVR